MRLPIAGVAAALVLAGCGGAAAPDDSPQIANAWVRLPAVNGRPGAAYFELRTQGQPVTLLKAATPIAVRTELHESMKGHTDMMTMKPLAEVPVPARSSLSFAPGGKHVMLYDIAPTVQAGDTVKFSLVFAASKDPVTVDARVIAAGDPAPQP